MVVTGTVNYEGGPLENGMIRFRPIQRTQAPSSGAQIVDGKYTADSHGGVVAGTYRIEIEAYRIDPAYDGPPPGPLSRDRDPPRQQYLPARYNTNSDLRLTIEPGSRKITKDFALTQ